MLKYLIDCQIHIKLEAAKIASERANSYTNITFDDHGSLHAAIFKAELYYRAWVQLLIGTVGVSVQNVRKAFVAVEVDFGILVKEDSVVKYLIESN